jgi:hypothetical protein
MKPVSLADISYEQGLKLLLLRKQALDAGSAQRLPPSALANSFLMDSTGKQVIKQAAGFWDQLKDTYQSGMNKITTDPGLQATLGYGLAGAGLGAAGAGGLAAARGEKNWKRRLLQGATAGGLLGGGLGLAMSPGSVTKPLEARVAGLTEQGMQTGELSDDAKKQNYVEQLKATANANPALGAAGTAAAGVGLGVGASRVARMVPGMKPIDHRYISQQLIDSYAKNPNSVDTGFLKRLVDTGDLDVELMRQKASPTQGNLNTLFSSPIEANKQKLVNLLEDQLPGKFTPTEAGVGSLFKDQPTQDRVAKNFINRGLHSNATGTKSQRSMLPTLRRGALGGTIGALGGIWSLVQYMRDRQAQQAATAQLEALRNESGTP